MNISHTKARQFIHSASFYELESYEIGALERHVANCKRCAEYAEGLPQLERLLTHSLEIRWPKPLMVGKSIQQVVADIEGQVRRKQKLNRVFGSLRVLAWAVGILVLVLVTSWVFTNLKPKDVASLIPAIVTETPTPGQDEGSASVKDPTKTSTPPPTPLPTRAPTRTPRPTPTAAPTQQPIKPSPTRAPTRTPRPTPTAAPTQQPIQPSPTPGSSKFVGIKSVLSATDLNCDGVEERVSGIARSKIPYFDTEQYQAIQMETLSDQGAEQVWEYSADEAGVSYLTYDLFILDDCNQFPVVIGHRGKERIKVFRWDENQMDVILDRPGLFFPSDTMSLSSFGINELSPQTFVTYEYTSASNDSKVVWTLWGFEWDGDRLIQTLEHRIEAQGGG
jgi:hypothetical protein